MADTSLIIKENDLRALLGVSRAALYVWRRRGLPVVSDGAPGRPPTYHMPAVRDWLRLTGFGIRCANGRSVDLEALRLEIDRRGGGVAPSGRPPSPAPAALPDRAAIGAFLGEMFQGCAIGWAAFIVARYKLAPDQVIELLADLLLFLVSDAGEKLQSENPDEFEFLYPDLLDDLKVPARRQAILDRVNELAAEIRRDLEADAAAGEASAT